MNIEVFAAVLSAFASFSVAMVTVFAALTRTPWWKARKAEEARRHQEQAAINKLIKAELNTNGGGSLTDKVNGTRGDVAALKQVVDDMASRMHTNTAKIDSVAADIRSNHAEGQAGIARLGDRDVELKQQIEAVTDRMDSIDKIVRDYAEALGPRLAVQDDVVRRTGTLEGWKDTVEEWRQRVDEKLFGGDQ